MSHHDEIRRLRNDLDSLLRQAGVIQGRIDALELALQREPEVAPTEPKPTEVVEVQEAFTEPPPLPIEAFTKVAEPATEIPLEEELEIRVAAREATAVPTVTPEESAALRTVTHPKAAPVSWEVSLGTYWLPRVGISLLGIAAVLFLGLAAQYSTPITRVGGGYLACFALLGAGWWLERRYPLYARVLYAGGLGLSYFVTYAAHYMPFARVIESTPLAIALLGAVVAFWAGVAQLRKSKSVAVLVTALGHVTVGLAALGSDETSQYAPFGTLVLSLGSGFFLLRNRWYYVGALGLLGSYVNHLFWMAKVGLGEDLSTFWIGLALLGAYFAIYALAELFSPSELRREAIPLWFRSGFVTLNTALFLGLSSALFEQYDFSTDRHHLLQLTLALALMVIALAYLRVRAGDPLFNVYMTKAVAVGTLGFATYFGSDKLGAVLAVETVALLYASRRSGLPVTRVLAFLVGIVAVLQAAAVTVDRGPVPYDNPDFTSHLVLSALTTAAFFFASQLYQRTDWTARSALTGLAYPLQRLLWEFDLAAPPDDASALKKPLDGLLFPYAYALCGGFLAAVYAGFLAQEGNVFVVYALVVLVLTILAGVLQSRPFGLVAVLYLPLCLVAGGTEITDGTGPAWLLAFGVTAIGVAAVRSDVRLTQTAEGLRFHQMRLAPYLHYGITTYLAALLLTEVYGQNPAATLWLAAIAAACAALALVLHVGALTFCATGAAVLAVLQWINGTGDTAGVLSHVIPFALAGGALGFDRYFKHLSAARDVRVYGGILVAIAALAMFDYVIDQAPGEWRPFWWGVVVIALTAYGTVFHSRTAFAVSVLVNAVAVFHIVATSYFDTLPVVPLISGFVILSAFWVACERAVFFSKWNASKSAAQPVAGLCVVIAAALLVMMLERVPTLRLYLLVVSWTVLAFALFGLSLPFHQKFYRFAGLGVFVLAMGRAFVHDVWQLEGFYKPAAFAVQGLFALVVAFGYLKAVERIGKEERREGERPAILDPPPQA